MPVTRGEGLVVTARSLWYKSAAVIVYIIFQFQKILWNFVHWLQSGKMKRNFLFLQFSHRISTCRSPHMDPRIDLHMDHYIDHHMDPHMDPQMDPYMDPLMDPHMDPYMDPRGYSYGSSYGCSTMNSSVENSNRGCCLAVYLCIVKVKMPFILLQRPCSPDKMQIKWA